MSRFTRGLTSLVSVGLAAVGAGLLTSCAGSAAIRRPSAADAGLRSEAEESLRRGCYACLKSALASWETLVRRGDPAAAAEWTKTALLLGARERELGLEPSTALADARREVEALNPDDPNRAAFAWALEIASHTPWLVEGVSKETLAERRARGVPRFEPGPPPPGVASTDPFVAYFELESVCEAVSRERTPGAARARLDAIAAQHAPSPLVTFRVARCPILDRGAALQKLLAAVPEFVEARYFLGQALLSRRRLVSAEAEFLDAANALPRMSAAWTMLGSTRVIGEEFEMAAGDFTRALSIVPDQRESLLGLARSLNYSGRFEEATVPARRLLDLGQWFVHDANYQLAFADLQLSRLEDADTHAREAQRTNPEDGDTARLVGLVAYRRDELTRAREQFEKAVSRNANDCESLIHLGLIHAREERFDNAAVAYLESRGCYERLEASIGRRFVEVDASSLSEARKESFRIRLGVRRAAAQRSQAAAAYGAAEAEVQRGRLDAALGYAELAARHPDFAARAGELKKRLLAQPKPAR